MNNLPCDECQYLKYFSDCKLICDEYKDAIYLEERLEVGL